MTTTVKALLDNSITEMFIDKKIVAKYRFKLQKLDRLVMVRNIDGTNNSGGAIIHQMKVNIYYKSHVKRIRMNMCNLQRTDIILDIPWLQVYNPEINWEIKEIKITRCPPIYGRKIVVKKIQRERKKQGGESKQQRNQIEMNERC